MTVARGIGLAALVLALIGAMLPLSGIVSPRGAVQCLHLAVLAATAAALAGDRGLTIATVFISMCGLLYVFVVLTPMMAAVFGGSDLPVQFVSRWLVIFSFALLGMPLLAITIKGRRSSPLDRQ